MPSALHTSLAASVPKPSLSRVDMAPPMRAMPDTRCWLEISRTAVVSDIPGIRMIRLDRITDLIASGTIHALTTMVIIVATRALMASLATDRRGRVDARMVMPPISRPITPATTMSTHELCRNSAAMQAADSP